MEQLDYQLDGSKELPNVIEYKWSKKTKRLFLLLIFFLILFIVFFIIVLIGVKRIKDDRDDLKKEKEKLKQENDELNDELEKENEKIRQNSLMFIFYNLTYADENNPIENTFRKDGKNYIKELGEINNGLNYSYTNLNIYDLYIPYSATQMKTKYNKVVVDIHGGAWLGGDKRYGPEADFCKSLTKLGFITASLDYTYLDVEYYSNVNIYRLVDEITTAIKNIKNFLKNEGFDENKLELCLTGGSAGAHLALLYSYLIKNSPIPVKFVVNMVGPVTLEPQYFFNVIDINNPLDNIDEESINKAKKESKCQKLDLRYNVVYLNIWEGEFKGSNFTELYDNVTQEVNTDSELYKAKLEKAKYAFPINHVEKETIPTLCIYGGKDVDVGIAHYSLLKKSFTQKGNENIELIYSKYSQHNIFEQPPEIKDKLFEEIYIKMLDYSNKYFSKD